MGVGPKIHHHTFQILNCRVKNIKKISLLFRIEGLIVENQCKKVTENRVSKKPENKILGEKVPIFLSQDKMSLERKS